MNFWSNFIVSIKRIGLIIWLIFASTTWLEQLLTRKMELELSATEGTSNIVWLYAASSAFLSLTTPIFTFIFVISSLNHHSLLSRLSKNLGQVVIENLRAAGKSLMWSLLFILPGLIRFLQFAFVTIIVMLDPDYELGKKDALKESTKLVNRSFFKISGLFLLFSVLIPLFETQWDEFQTFSEHPLTATLLTGMDSLFSIIFILILIRLWEKNHGTHVQLATN